MFFRSKIAAIEFLGDEVRIAVIKSGGRTPLLLELSSRRAEYEQPEQRTDALVQALDEALAALRTRPVAYVLCVDTSSAIVRQLSIPFRGRRRVAAAVPFEIEPYLAFPLEDLMVDFNVVAEIDGETEVLALGMRRQQIEEEIAILEAAGIEAESVTLDAVSLTGLWQAVDRKKLKGLTAVVHARESSSSLVILHNGKPAYLRHLSSSGARMREAPASAAREIQNTLRAFLAKWRGEGEIAELNVTGIDFTPEEREAFSQAMRLPVNDLMLAPRLRGGDLTLQDGPMGAKYNTWEAVIGAAFGASSPGWSIDFKGELGEAHGSVRSLVVHLMFSACLAMILSMGWIFYYFQGVGVYQAEMDKLKVQIGALNKEVEALQGKGIGSNVDVDLFNDPPFLLVLNEIAARLPGDKVTITDIKLAGPENEGWWMRIQGTVSDATVFQEVFTGFKQSPLFRVDDEPEIALVNAQTTFNIKVLRPTERKKNESKT